MSDVTERMPPRMSLLRQMALVAMAFSIGLFLGLCLHLPAVINTTQGQDLPRSSRSLVLEARKSLSNSPHSQLRHNKTSGHQWLRSKVKAIRETYDNIRAVRGQHQEEGQPVYGSRTVTVLVSGQNPDPPEGYHGYQDLKKNNQQDFPVHHQGDTGMPGDVRLLRQSEFLTLGDLVTDGVYWSRQMEALLPPGFTEDEVSLWRRRLGSTRVVGMEAGCGRMQNRRLLLEDGGEACARYRINTDQIQGEVFSYYLGRLLHLPNLPPTALAVPAAQHNTTWANVHQQVSAAEWSPEKPVVLTPWLPRLRPVLVPRELRQPGARDETGNIDVLQNLHPSRLLLSNRSLEDLVELVQWSDLVIFDYLNANVDRLVNNMFNLQWNSEMMNSATHNLESRVSDGLLVFIDNESGLFHSYRLLDKYSHYHETLLRSLCVFRAGTAAALKRLHKSGSVGRELMALYRNKEPLHWTLPEIPESNVKILENRIGRVVDQIRRCESRYRTEL